jgi:hypothetical protein
VGRLTCQRICPSNQKRCDDSWDEPTSASERVRSEPREARSILLVGRQPDLSLLYLEGKSSSKDGARRDLLVTDLRFADGMIGKGQSNRALRRGVTGDDLGRFFEVFR